MDHFLSAVLILALALVIGLGIGHFLGEYSAKTKYKYLAKTKVSAKTASHTRIIKLQEFSIQSVEVFTPKCSV